MNTVFEKPISTEIDELNSNIANFKLKTTGLSLTNCSIYSGGYAEFGNLVIIHMRITASNSNEVKTISGLPIPATNAINFRIDTGSGDFSAGFVNPDGTINISNSALTANRGMLIQSVYMKN